MGLETGVSVFNDIMNRGLVTATALAAPWELAGEDLLPLEYYQLKKSPIFFSYPWEMILPKYVIEIGTQVNGGPEEKEQLEDSNIYVRMSPVNKYRIRIRIRSIKMATPNIVEQEII